MTYQELPPLSSDQLRALRDDIAQRGAVLVPVEIDENGDILDGHHRAQIADELGIDYPTRVRQFTDNGTSGLEKRAYAIAANLNRRNLSPEQWREARARQQEIAHGLREAGRTQEETAEIIGVSRELIKYWEHDISNGKSTNTNTPDLRTKLGKRHKEEIKNRLKSGDQTQAEIAADFAISQGRISQIKTEFQKEDEIERQRAAAAEAGSALELPSDIEIITGDMRDVLADWPENSVDFIFTDPPYDKKNLHLYGPLAEHAARLLKPGGSLITFAGHYALPTIFELMTPHLRYWWTCGVRHTGGHRSLTGVNVHVYWKPLLWFVKETRGGKEYVADMVTSKPPGKAHHDWEQGLEEASYYIDHLTEPGDLILDPFAGSGTTCIAAFVLGRRSVGIEFDEQQANIARSRIHDHTS